MLRRREFLASLAVLPSPSRPNFVALVSDQQHWRAAGFADPFFDTPHLDALARESAVFESAFCSTPQCSPSRSSLWTGDYPSRTGVWGNVGAAGGNPLKQKTVGMYLQESGYRTAYFGKWHLGDDPKATAGWSEEWREEGDAEVTRRALDFLKRQTPGSPPFALFLNYLNPHKIYEFRRGLASTGSLAELPKSWHSEEYAHKPAIQKQFMTEDQGRVISGREQAAWEHYREFYRGKVRDYDAEAGRVLDALRATGLFDRTIVVATSDHGDMDTNHRLIFKGPFMYEHMVRVPFIVRVPAALGGQAARGHLSALVVNIDLTPTLLEFAGLPLPNCHGRSLKPALTGGRWTNRQYVVSEYYSKQKWVNPARMLRTADWKYNAYGRQAEELYDLKNDPDELVNLAGDPSYAQRKEELREELDAWMEEQRDPFYSLKPTTRDGKPLAV